MIFKIKRILIFTIKIVLILIAIRVILSLIFVALMTAPTAERWLHEQLHKEEYISAKIFIIPFMTVLPRYTHAAKEESFAVCNYKYKEDKQLMDSVIAFSLRNPLLWDTLHKYFDSYSRSFYLVDTTHNHIHNLEQEYWGEERDFKLFYEIIWKIEKDSMAIEISMRNKEYFDRYTYLIPITPENKQYILNPYQLDKKFLYSYWDEDKKIKSYYDKVK